MNRRMSWLVVCATVSLSALAPQGEAAVGRTSGAGSVSQIGTAQYTIPIWTPPGIHGVQPSLALTYSSSMGDGYYGVGWALSGLSTISRCERTWEQDGVADDVRNLATDRFCINGAKLRLTGGTYGSAGSTYQTEIATFQTITASGTAGNGPAYFTVQGSNGVTYEYGNTVDSQIESVSQTTVRTWALNAIRDANGNAMLLAYDEDANGSFRISTITYTQNTAAGVSAGYSVEFISEPLPTGEVDSKYQGGSKIKRVKRVDRIDVKSGTTIVRRYELTYEAALSSTSKSRLASVKECANPTTDCLAPTTFTYRNGTAGLNAEVSTGQAVPANVLPWPMDVNGDGRKDLVYPSSTTAGGTWKVMFGNASGGYDPPTSGGFANTNWSGATPIDYNADGLEDLLVPGSGGTWLVLLGSTSGLSTTAINTLIATTATGTGTNARGLDVNGDGYEDLVYAELYGYDTGGDRIVYRLREPGGTFAATVSVLFSAMPVDTMITSGLFAPGGQPNSSRAPDFNGDGRGDLAFWYTARTFIDGPNTYTYHRFIQVVCQGGDTMNFGISAPTTPRFGDFNGDGRTDILYTDGPPSNRWWLKFSTGHGFSGAVQGPSTGDYGAARYVVMDWDGDGSDDFLIPSSTTHNWDLVRSDGEALAAPVNTGVNSDATDATVTDVDGDGLADLAYNVGGTWKYRTHAGIKPDLLISATDGYGVTTTFNYVPISQGNYTKYANAVFPHQDYNGSLYVVSSLTASNGIGGTYTQSFQYYGATFHLQGRGFEGFDAKRTIDSRNSLQDYQYYRRDFPYQGALYKDDLYQSDGTTIRHVETTFATTTLDATTNNQRVFPHPSSSTTVRYEVGGIRNGLLISTGVTNYTFDNSGNATTVASTVTDNDTSSPHWGHQWGSTTVNTISPQAGCLGLPTQVAVTNTAPGVSSLTRTTSYTPDYTHCRPTQETIEPASLTYKITRAIGYDSFGNNNSVGVTGIGMAIRTTSMSWGTRGQFPVSVTNPLSQTTSMDYNYDLGVQTSQTDPNTLLTTWGYDNFARKTSETRPDGTSSAWTYADCAPSCVNANNRMTVTQAATDTGSSVITDQFTYLDQFDRPLVSTQRLLDGGYNRVETQYDSLGRVTQQSVPCAAASCTAYWQSFGYDAVNRVIQQQRPISATNSTLQTSSIDYRGLTTILTDAQGKTTTRIGSVAGTLIRSQDNNSYYQGFTYDAFGSLLSVTDGLLSVPGRVPNTLFAATYDYGAQAFQRTITDMDLGTRSYNYNALGEMISGSDGKGQLFSATFDALSRPLSRYETEGSTAWNWGNNAASFNIGALAGVCQYPGTPQPACQSGYSESYMYDTKGRLSNRQIVSDASYAYDYSYSTTTGLPDTVTYPTSTSSYRLKLQYLYQNGILQQVKDFNASTVFWQANTTNPAGQVTQETLGNGAVTNRAFDAVTGWVKSIQSGLGSGAALQNESYLFDEVGNVTQRQNGNAGLTENFYYDNLDRLDHSMLGAATNLSLAYDEMGNITSRSDIASGAAWTYDASKKHAVRQAGSASYTYTYDANGNAQTRNGYNISWTSYNYPSVINGPNKTLTFSYGPNRQRFKQVYNNGSTLETTMYIGGMLEKVTTGGVDDWRHYVSAGGQTVAVVSRLSTGTNATRYMLEDHQGSLAQLTDSAGASYVSESFTAFGARRDAGNWSAACNCTDLAKMKAVTRMGYTGQEAIGGVSMGLNHMNGRVQDAITGRFLSPDPFISDPGNTQNYNRYSYVGNNPLRFTDPSGFMGKDRPHAHQQDGSQISPAEEAGLTAANFNFYLQYQMQSGSLNGGGNHGTQSVGPDGQHHESPTQMLSENVLQGFQGASAGTWERRRVHGGDSSIVDIDNGEVPAQEHSPTAGQWEFVRSTVGGTSWWSQQSTVTFCGRACAAAWDGDPNSQFAPRENTASNGERTMNAINAMTLVVPVEGLAGKGTTFVIGKLADLGALRAGEQTLLKWLPDLGNPAANWAQNSGVLRQVMSVGRPIRDATVDAMGRLINNTGFLRAERYLMESRGWTYDAATRVWNPPGAL